MKIPYSLRLWWFRHKFSYGHAIPFMSREMVDSVFVEWDNAASAIYEMIVKHSRRSDYTSFNITAVEGFELKPEVIQWISDNKVEWKLIIQFAPELGKNETDAQLKKDMIYIYFLDELQAVEFKLMFL